MTKPTAFEIAVPEPQLADLRNRLQRRRWPDEPAIPAGPSISTT
jgi:hypothetical protein